MYPITANKVTKSFPKTVQMGRKNILGKIADVLLGKENHLFFTLTHILRT